MDFSTAWNLPIGTRLKVSNGVPPPSTNKEGMPYRVWRSHNFVGTLEEKINFEGWRSLKIALDNNDTPDIVEYLAYSVQEDVFHTFELV